jgi:Tol biopolymer transport system component
MKVLKPTPQRVTNLSRLTSDPGLTSFPAISNDGSLVAYASDRAGSGNLDIWVQQFSGGQTIRVTSEETDEYEPVFSPDGAMIAFRSERDGGGIYVIPALGGSQRLVVRHGRSPAFSPDGQQIAYAVGSAGVGATFSFGASSIFVVPVNGGEPKRIAPNFAVAHHPVWSEDGTHILFEGNRVLGPPDFEICAASATTGELVACTDIFKQLRTQKLSIGPYPIAVNGQTIFFSVGVGDSVNLWRARLTRDWKLQGQPEQLTFGTGLERQPSVSRNNRMVFTSGLQNTDVWELPVDANNGAVTGDPRQLTRDAAEDYYPEIAANGSRIAFISSRGGNDDVWILDPGGKPTSLMSTPARELYPKLTADGSTVVFSSIENGRRGVFMMPATGGVPKKLCDDCGLPRDVTADASKVLLQTGPPPSVSLLEVATGKIEPLLTHKEQPIYAPKLSPDENWVAFQVVQRPTSRVIYAAPFRPSGKTETSEWVQITDGSVMDRNPAWSPDGSLLYFLSERDSFRCIWAQRVDRATKKPVGRPFAVAHFHNSVRSLMNIDGPGQVSLSVAKDRLIFAMGEIVANIWLAQLGSGR